ncbi:MAG: hypothetical protein WC683_14165, partial [bacterium]
MKTTPLSLLVALVSALMLSTAAPAIAYPPTLDEAQLGPASKQNPLFTTVLTEPVTDGDWFKLAETLYEGPTTKVYQYNPDNGTFGVLGGVTRIGDRMYGPDGKLISRIIEDYDSQGNLVRTRVLGNYTYDSSGRLIGYTREDYDAAGILTNRYDYIYEEGVLSAYRSTRFDVQGNPTAITDYDAYTYDSQGKASGYHRTDMDGSGNVLQSYDYSQISYHANGRTAGYERVDYNAQGTMTAQNVYAFNDSGLTTSRVMTSYDSQGGVTGSSTYANYSYDAENRVTQYDRTSRDAGGNITTAYEYRGYSYHPNGTTAAYTRTDKDGNGDVTSTNQYAYSDNGLLSGRTQMLYSGGTPTNGYQYSDYAYNSSNQHTSYKLDYLDGSGNVTQTLYRSSEAYDTNNRLSSYTDKRYGSTGSFTS